MGLHTGIARRGAVYYWRKRLPDGLAERIGVTHVKFSLKTREAKEARYLGACLNARAADVVMSEPPTISREQLESLFRETFEQHRRKLSLLADFSRSEADFDPKAEEAEETAAGWAYRLFSRKGLAATVDEDDREGFRKAGLPEDIVDKIEPTLERMKASGEAKPSMARLADAIRATGAEVSAGTTAMAQPIYLRALGEALLKASERYNDDPLDFDTLLGSTSSSSTEAMHASAPPNADTTSNPAEAAASRADDVQTEPSRSEQPSHASASRTDTIEIVAEKLAGKKLADGVWDEKTARQARMIFDLFDRFLREEAAILGLSELKQSHLDAFEEFLRTLHKSYGKSPKDRERSIAELRRESAAKPEAERGLSGGTRNRHLTFLGQLLRRAKSAGISINADLDLTEFRARKAKRGRDDRPVPSRTQIETFFRQPVFRGCKDWNAMHHEGPQVFHRAAFFGPLLANYQGMRREEYCGLSVDDIVVDNGEHPYIHLCFNEFRRLKNHQSVRNLALHPELIRLNFLDYVEAIKALGYRRLFPDLYSPTSQSLLGDRLYDELRPSFKCPIQKFRCRSNTLRCVG
ncbi:DUF6538 domain-containing protein [Jiella avicenniae]|uniref:DUF6538 domain-containing protein n=1 Tax=Jiella avicenniae TaxID=2907202 RepID=A0A9X1T5M5_9HYPH|nr:DUF6538 domain-containing protein [Jiella avicenniae]MCE7028375.1 hypothetical protein [Jiella avicenniae]